MGNPGGLARILGLLLLGSGLFIGCKQLHEGARESAELEEALPGRIQEADSILTVRQIVDPSSEEQVPGEAIAILGGKILAVSTRDGILRYRGVRTKLQEFAQAYAYPGLIDAHGHLRNLGMALEEPEQTARRSCRSRQEGPPEDVERQLLVAQRACLGAGITRVHDAGTSSRVRRTLRRLEQAGIWKLGVYGMLLAAEAPLPAMDDPGPAARLRFPALKIFADSHAGSMSEQELEWLVALCVERGYQPCTHASGSSRLVLDVYARLLRGDLSRLRPRIEHAGLVAPEDLPLLASLGIIACLQPLRSEGAPVPPTARKLLEQRARVCLGSDFPTATPSPFEGIYAAVRTEQLTRREALLGYSGWAAYAAGEEALRGRVRPGFVADLTILDRNLLRVPEEALLGTKVLATVVAGETVYRSDHDVEKPPWMPTKQR
ncbi:MAG: amidohydrolase [Planctomycetota bacterium]